jgi:hypothetical protein
MISEDFPMERVQNQEKFSTGRAQLIKEFSDEYKAALDKVEKIKGRIAKLRQDEVGYAAELAAVDVQVKAAKERAERIAKQETMDVDDTEEKGKFAFDIFKLKGEFHLISLVNLN